MRQPSDNMEYEVRVLHPPRKQSDGLFDVADDECLVGRGEVAYGARRVKFKYRIVDGHLNIYKWYGGEDPPPEVYRHFIMDVAKAVGMWGVYIDLISIMHDVAERIEGDEDATTPVDGE